MMNYDDFIKSKKIAHSKKGMDATVDFSSHLFPHQRDVVDFLLKCGSGAAFLDTGLGKTNVELEWATKVVQHTNKPLLYLAPLAVGKQHSREAGRFGYDVKFADSGSDVKGSGIYITNYEKLHKFDESMFGSVVLDESSIIKSYGGATSKKLMAFASSKDWVLAASATPAPNDHMELGQHSQFLGAMSSNEMLARWFIADQSEMGRYRLKKSGVKDFWRWVASWARCVGKPSDLGYSDDGYVLPGLNEITHFVGVDMTDGAEDGELIRSIDCSATSIHKEKRKTAKDRAEETARIIEKEKDEYWMIWVETDYDAEAVMAAIPHAVEVSGKMSPEVKEERLDAFSTGQIKVLVSKPKIAGMGLNWQHCARTVFCGLSFSYEAYYQAIRRFYRFGQTRQVDSHIVLAETEQAIWQAIQRKKREHEYMKEAMFSAMREEVLKKGVKEIYNPTQKAKLPSFI